MGGNPGIPEAKEESVLVGGPGLLCNDAAGSSMKELELWIDFSQVEVMDDLHKGYS